jgi:PAS domain S-box-containing protein
MKEARAKTVGVPDVNIERAKARLLPIVVAAVVVVAAFCSPLFAGNTPPAKNVLVLYSFSDPDLFDRLDSLKASVRSRVRGPVTFHVEYLETQRFEDPGYEKSLSETMRHAYGGERLDLVIVAAYPALHFALTHRGEIFPGVPIVFSYVHPSRIADQVLPPGVTGVTVTADILDSLDLAFRLQPDTKNVAFVTGTSEFERYWLAVFRNEYHPFEKRANLIALVGLPTDQLMRQVSALPPHTVVFFNLTPQFSTQPVFGTYDALAAISRRFPAYCIISTSCMDHGSIGGYYADYTEQSAKTGELASRILSGEKPENIPVLPDSGARAVVDSRQLRRWNIAESALPSGSLVLNRQPPVWELYWKYVFGAVALLLLQALLIFYMLWQRRKRRRVEESLVEQLAFEHLLFDLSTTFINLNEEEVAPMIDKSLGRIARFLSMDRITVHEFSRENAELMATYSWHAEGVQPVPPVVKASEFPWRTSLVLRGETVVVSDLDALPEQASVDKQYFRNLDVVSLATVPLKTADELFGCIAFVRTKHRLAWTAGLVQRLKILAEIFSNALMRKRAQQVRSWHAAIVESSDDAIVSKNLDGVILSWNAGAERVFGYTSSDTVGHSIIMLIPPELWDEEDRILQRLRTGERIRHFETIRVTKDGRRINVSLTLSPVRDSKGQVVAVSKIARDVTDQKRAEQVLRESEERFRLVADRAPVFIWMSGADKQCTFFNQGWLDFTGRSMEQELGEGWVSGVHPDDLAHCLKTYSRAFDARMEFEMEYRLRRFDGKYRWIIDYGVPRFESDGAFCGYVGTCVDITDRKATEESLEDLSGRLITAQEEERTRIARELHDDFSQRLALLGIGLGRLWKKRPESEEDERILVGELWSRTKEICSDVHRLSHQLHSSKLDHVGLGGALMGLCEEISEKQGIEIEFTECGVPSEIPKDVALCLFRVAQESLNNVVKHSQARKARAELYVSANEVRLRILDGGVGFDPDFRSAAAGIGLVGMHERLRLVGGRLSVQSSPLRGTEILAEIPLSMSAHQVKIRAHAAGRMET